MSKGIKLVISIVLIVLVSIVTVYGVLQDSGDVKLTEEVDKSTGKDSPTSESRGKVDIVEDDMMYDAVEESVEGEVSSNDVSGNSGEHQRKLISNGIIEIMVEDVVAVDKEIRDYVDQIGGFIESSSFETMEGDEVYESSITVRVPQEQFDETMLYLDGKGRVLSQETSVEDVTEKHLDLTARINNLETQEERYLEMIDIANDIEEMLQIEERLADIRGQIERHQTQLDNLDDSISYSTIEIQLVEEREIYEVTFHANGGMFYGVASDKEEKSIDVVEGAFIDDFPEAFKEGDRDYEVKEWNTQKDSDGKKLRDDTPIEKDMKVYAVWEDITESEGFYTEAFRDLSHNVRESFLLGVNTLIKLFTSLLSVVVLVLPFIVVFGFIGFILFRKKFKASKIYK